jgi:hypothetical protein
MSAKPAADWVQLGWKAWYYRNNEIEVYSSKTHSWAELPSNGVQVVFRYYQNTSSLKKWREVLHGDDIYTESYQELFNSRLLASRVKLGVVDDKYNALRRQADAELLSDDVRNYAVDNTLSSYSRTDKILVGWKCWAVVNDSVVTYNDTTNNWLTDVPNQNILYVSKLWRAGKDKWRELVGGRDIYTLTKDDEDSIILLNSKFKQGSVIDEATLDTIEAQARADTEEF